MVTALVRIGPQLRAHGTELEPTCGLEPGLANSMGAQPTLRPAALSRATQSTHRPIKKEKKCYKPLKFRRLVTQSHCSRDLILYLAYI